MNSESPDTPWLLSQMKAKLGSQWLKFKQLLGCWSQRKTQLRTQIKRIASCLNVSEKTNRKTKKKSRKCILSLADGLKERSSLGTVLWVEFLLCIRRIWKWKKKCSADKNSGTESHWWLPIKKKSVLCESIAADEIAGRHISKLCEVTHWSISTKIPFEQYAKLCVAST